MLSALDLVAQTEVKTNIDSVTVYVSGAIVNRSARITVKNGTTTYLLTDLSSELDEQSIRVGIDNQDVTIVSINHRLDTKEDAEKKKLRSAADRRKELLKDSLAILSAKLDVIEEERNLIVGNNKIATHQKILRRVQANRSKRQQHRQGNLHDGLHGGIGIEG